MSFWRTFGFRTVSAIDNILDKESFTLEELLDEEELLQEVKSQNRKLLEYICTHDILSKLIKYITVEAIEGADTKESLKYPYVSCEILCSEVWQVCDAFYQDTSLLDQLYAFLDKDPPLNTLLGSYVARVASVLLQRKIPETVEYMKGNDMIPKFIKHLGTGPVMDLLLQVISYEEAETRGILKWLCDINLIKCLIDKFDKNNPPEVHENTAQAIVDIITVSCNSSSVSPLMSQLENEESIKQLFESILSNGLSSNLLQGLCVVIALLRGHSPEILDEVTTFEFLSPLHKATIENMGRLYELLLEHSNVTIRGTYGDFNPFGFHRLKILEFFEAVVGTNIKRIHDELIKMNFFSGCMDIFFLYPWNNFLHFTVEQMIQDILKGENINFKISLIRDCKLLDRIIEADKGSAEDCTKAKGSRRGYMGFVTAMSVNIQTAASFSLELKALVDENAAWTDYVCGSLADALTTENKPLGGHLPIGTTYESSTEDEDEEEEEEEDEEEEDEDEDNGELFERYQLRGFGEDFAEFEEDGEQVYERELPAPEFSNDDEKSNNFDEYEDDDEEEEEVEDDNAGGKDLPADLINAVNKLSLEKTLAPEEETGKEDDADAKSSGEAAAHPSPVDTAADTKAIAE